MTTHIIQKAMGPAPNADPMILMQNGANWFLYKRRIIITLGSKQHLLKHLEGRAQLPTPPSALSADPTKDEENEYNKLFDEYEDKLDEWTTRDYVVQRQITSTIPDSIFIRIQNCSTAADMWNILTRVFEANTMQAAENKLRVRTQLRLARCRENENVRKHVDRMQHMLEELAGMGVTIADSEYAAILIQSMPKSYGDYLAVVSAALKAAGISLTPDMVIEHALYMYDQRQEDAPRRNGKQTGESTPFSFATGNGKSGRRGRRSSKGKEKRSCFSCGKEGHLKRDCTEPKCEQHQPGCERRI